MDRQEWDALLAHLRALEAKYAAQAAQPRAPDAAPAPPPAALRRERSALWRIAMVCRDALRNRAVPPEMRPYFLQIARVCREGIQREDSDRGDHGT